MQSLNDILKNLCLLDIRKPVILGFSGGPDSMALADALDFLKFPFHAVHVNHRLRPEADDEEVLVREIARQRGWSLSVEVVDCDSFARTSHRSVEDAARQLRYRALFATAEVHEAQAVITAHHADDQAETILMHILRGSGLSGITGMHYRSLPNAWSNTIPLVRPMLDVWRTDILAYCEKRGLVTVHDSSNQDVGYLRNRIRWELLPTLESYNPKVKQHLVSLAKILHDDDQLLGLLADEAWLKCVREEREGFVRFSTQCLRMQSLPVIRRIFRRAAFQVVPGLNELDFSAVERLVDFLDSPTRTRRMNWMGGIQASMEGAFFVLYSPTATRSGNFPQMTADGVIKLDIPGRLDLGNGWTMEAFVEESTIAENLSFTDPLMVYVDADKIQSPLSVRRFSSGDRFEPYGMPGTDIRLGDFFTNAHVPLRVRKTIPLVCHGRQIIWVAGVRLAHFCRITETTRRIVCLRCYSVDEDCPAN